jgi:sugar transferase (PEP-CTERM/EpsH1 system associated)
MDRPSLLYLVHRVPYPPDKGDRIRAFHLLKYLAQRSRLYLACLADEPVPSETEVALRNYCERLAIVSLHRRMRWLKAFGSLAAGHTITEGAFSSSVFKKLVQDWAREVPFTAAIGSASSMVPYLQLAELREASIVIDLVDVDSQKWFDYAAISHGVRSWVYHTEGKRLRKLEEKLPAWTRAVTLVSEAEADLYREFCSQGAVHGVTNGVDLKYFQPGPKHTEKSCVFIGVLDYRPNVEGLCWLCRHVWPDVHRLRPGTKLYLVGKSPAPQVRRLADLPGVELVGPVPDVRPYLARAAVTLVPLQVARGVQNKILEALAMAKATIVSPEALTGLQAEPNVHVLQADTPAQWVESILAVLDDPGLQQRLGAAGRRYVEEHHSWDHCLEPFGQLLGLTKESTCSVDS